MKNTPRRYSQNPMLQINRQKTAGLKSFALSGHLRKTYPQQVFKPCQGLWLSPSPVSLPGFSLRSRNIKGNTPQINMHPAITQNASQNASLISFPFLLLLQLVQKICCLQMQAVLYLLAHLLPLSAC
ncbi:hypothetical protein Barb4_00057 [Bacteroidales bacterium Barb4]|nr:hypothetical protein Barb4_00057 [Bacteroidales bacterium Barb4]